MVTDEASGQDGTAEAQRGGSGGGRNGVAVQGIGGGLESEDGEVIVDEDDIVVVYGDEGEGEGGRNGDSEFAPFDDDEDDEDDGDMQGKGSE